MDLLRSNLSRVRIPEPTNRIYKQECCVSFDTPVILPFLFLFFWLFIFLYSVAEEVRDLWSIGIVWIVGWSYSLRLKIFFPWADKHGGKFFFFRGVVCLLVTLWLVVLFWWFLSISYPIAAEKAWKMKIVVVIWFSCTRLHNARLHFIFVPFLTCKLRWWARTLELCVLVDVVLLWYYSDTVLKIFIYWKPWKFS